MARRKITENQNLDAAELPELTAQQSAFVRFILDGETASDAYRKSYDCSSMKSESIWVEASKLRRHPNVALWLATARKAELGQARVTLDQHIRRLDRLQQVALETGNVGAAVQAEQLIGKASGHYVERFADVSGDDPMHTLEQIASQDPDIAKALAEKHGISLTEH